MREKLIAENTPGNYRELVPQLVPPSGWFLGMAPVWKWWILALEGWLFTLLGL